MVEADLHVWAYYAGSRNLGLHTCLHLFKRVVILLMTGILVLISAIVVLALIRVSVLAAPRHVWCLLLEAGREQVP